MVEEPDTITQQDGREVEGLWVSTNWGPVHAPP
jgi:hypothetical protein